MGRINITAGVNLRASAHKVPRNQAMLLQNYDMNDAGDLEQIPGSVRYHGDSLDDTLAPSAIIPYYNNLTNDAKVLAAVNDKILIKKGNEFQELISNLTPNGVRFSVNIENEEFIASRDGLLRFDGIKKISVIANSPKMKDIIYSRETNRCFALDSEIPNQLLWTDDLSVSDNLGLPLSWPGLNANVVPPTKGDVIEKLWFLDGRLVLLMTNSTWIQYVNGPPENWRFKKMPTIPGWIAPKTIKQVGNEIWGLGFSTETGRGVYAFNGVNSRFLSYDVTPELNRINDSRIQEACAEYVDNIYKLSYARDMSLVNDYTLHFDTINLNQNTNSPNIYGPHTYGFNSSAGLNTRQFKGEHLFGTYLNSESRIFEVGNYQTQHATGPVDDGDLIQTIFLTGIITSEETQDGVLDSTFWKRFENIFVEFIPKGSWSLRIEILRDFFNETFKSYDQILEGGSTAVNSIDLDSDSVDLAAYSSSVQLQNIISRGIQFKISNTQVNQSSIISSISYDARFHRREKGLQRVRLAEIN